MANQEENPPQQEQPFVAAKQVGFILKDIILNTNNEVALLYPEHNNKDYFKYVSISFPNVALENHLPDLLTLGVNTFRNAIGTHYLPHCSEYVAPPPIDVVSWRLLMAQIIRCLRGKTGGFDQITNKDAIILYSLANGINIDYANIFWEDIIIKLKKKQREKVVPYTRFLSLLIMHKMKEGYRDDEVTLHPTQIFTVNNWALKPNQPEEPPFTNYMLAICATDKPVVFKAPKTSTKAESVSQGTKPGAQTGYKKPLTS
ncbi:hypothetical protein Tco_0886644 [Tanacetum coccineum]